MRTQSIMIAQLNNGKNVKSITKSIEKERALINQTETSYELDKRKKKEHDHAVRMVRQRALQRWIDKKNE